MNFYSIKHPIQLRKYFRGIENTALRETQAVKSGFIFVFWIAQSLGVHMLFWGVQVADLDKETV